MNQGIVVGDSRGSLGAVEDIMLGGELLEYMGGESVDCTPPFEKVEELFSKFDAVFCNLECPLFKSDPKRSENWIVYSFLIKYSTCE